jgi:hypothetical protein
MNIRHMHNMRDRIRATGWQTVHGVLFSSNAYNKKTLISIMPSSYGTAGRAGGTLFANKKAAATHGIPHAKDHAQRPVEAHMHARPAPTHVLVTPSWYVPQSTLVVPLSFGVEPILVCVMLMLALLAKMKRD